jgi:hypothetical protein
MLAAQNLADVASATTSATNLGLGTGNSPQFTAVNIGHASDTTVSRDAAGQIAVEGVRVPTISSTNTLTNKTVNLANNTLTGTADEFNTALSDANFYTSGGTDVALADGGTGASLADPNADRVMFFDDSAGAVTWLTMGTGLTITGTTLDATSGTAATQAEQEAGASTAVMTTPGRQHFHPSAAKAWVKFNASGTVAASYNITSVTDSAVGVWTVNIGTDFSSADYVGVLSIGSSVVGTIDAIAAGTFQIRAYSLDGAVTASDPNTNTIQAAFFGDHA